MDNQIQNDNIDIFDLIRTNKDFESIIKAQLNNEQIADHLETLIELDDLREIGDYKTINSYEGRILRCRTCHKVIHWDKALMGKIAIYKKTYHCRDRFCFLCNSLLSATRTKKFLEVVYPKIKDDYSFYMMTLTCPNSVGDTACPSDDRPHINTTIERMTKAFGYLIYYLKGRRDKNGNYKGPYIAGINLEYLGYAGAFLSFECTYKDPLDNIRDNDQTKPKPKWKIRTEEYHPHYHVIVAFRKGLVLKEQYLTTYSYSYSNGNVVIPFSDFAILLQKIWRLLIECKTVTKEAIDALGIEDGYSCQCKLIKDENFKQAFKYPFKPDSERPMSFNIFSDLSHVLKGKQTVRAYGCFRGHKLEQDTIDNAELSLAQRLRLQFALLDPLIHNPYDVLDPDPLVRSNVFPNMAESPKESIHNITLQKCLYLTFKELHLFEKKGNRVPDVLLEDLVNGIAKLAKDLTEVAQKQAKQYIQTVLDIAANPSHPYYAKKVDNDDYSILDEIF